MFSSGVLPDKYTVLLWTILLTGLGWVGTQDYPLFHSLIEVFTVVIAWGIFVIAWNSRDIVHNGYLLFLGTAYLFVGLLELLHMLAYKGMDIFPDHDADLPTQLWIVTRYIESFSLLIAPGFIRKRVSAGLSFAAYVVIVSAALLSIFYWRNFPACFVEGSGLTPFKIVSEYGICLILAGSIVTLRRKRSEFDAGVFRLMVGAIAVTIVSELAFTLYVDVYGFWNMTGHFLSLIASYLVYRAFIVTGISMPFQLVFRNLARSEKNLFSLLEELPAFVFVQMPDGAVQYGNRVFRDLFGEPDGKRCYQLLRGRDVRCDNCPTERVFESGDPQQREWNVAGSRTYAMYEYPYRDIDDKPAVLKLGIDITTRKGVETALREARDQMENRVLERTAELTRVNKTLQDEIVERRRIQEVLQQSEIELRRISSRLLHAQEMERKRIAMELHDSLGGSLSAVKFRAENAICKLEASPTTNAVELFSEFVPMIQSLIEEVRRIHSNIWPSVLSDLGLKLALSWQCRKFEENFPRIRTERKLDLDEGEIPDSLKIVIYRIVQEALNNVAKHSGADQVSISLNRNDGLLELVVCDNGVGFDASRCHDPGRSSPGVGLGAMRERARLSGGALTLDTGGIGTQVKATWPLTEREGS